MTREEAISILKQYIDYNNPDVTDFYTMEEAIEVVIKALEQEPYGKDINVPTTDAISRQAAIDALTKTSGIRGDALKALYDLPLVKPQYTEAEIQKMQDLESVEIQTAYEIGKAEGSEVLDEIRAEIENYKLSEDELSDADEDSVKWGMKIAYDIVDKYKASQTGAEGSEE